MTKTIKRLLLALLLFLSSSLLLSCGGDGIGGTGNPHESSVDLQTTITQIPVPFREHGYSNFETLIIHSQSKFDAFIGDVKHQSNWNNKDAFLQKLQNQNSDFTKENIILYRFTESSGSISLSAQTPVITNSEATVKITRQAPSIGTSDMAYYLLAYRAGKEITKVIFDNGTSQVEVEIPTAQGKLVRSDDTKLLDYFKGAIKAKTTNTNKGAQDGEVTFSNATGDSNESASGVSTTNIQEAGVDEADLIKTDGRYIFSVKKTYAESQVKTDDFSTSSDFNSNNTEIASDTIRIMDTQNSSGIIEIKKLSDKNNPWHIAGLYLHKAKGLNQVDKGNSDKKQLIALSSEKQQYLNHWFDSYYFSSQKTDVLFIDVNDPAKASINNKLSFEGQLIDSRRNGDVLYLILRHYPDYQYTNDQKLATTNNKTFLPSYQLGTAEKQLITKPEDCYLEKGQKGSADIITLVAVDLSSVTPQVNSQCYVGSAEAVYASKNALYLATTRWEYQTENNNVDYRRQSITTDVHKFSYKGLSFDYRGSGEVNGHLGYKQDSKSFRFSEYDGLLRVVTFDEQMWGLTTVQPLEDTTNDGVTTGSSKKQTAKKETPKSPVLISILKEQSDKKALQLVSTLPNDQRTDPIGLPREKLYATRFIGNRAYVVTFRVTDPLYVIDLSNPTDPKIAGELKVDGYSDYLHPISENLLLGVGKDAIPDQARDNGDGRGAWYQGVKLSLIDVTDPENPREADKIILGKRGTDSTALSSHHAITGLKINNTYRIAIPINMHAETPSNGNIQEPFAYYGYSHTGLYRFEVDINNQTITKIPAMIVNDYLSANGTQHNREIDTDRSIFINDEVFYMHQGDFWSQDWQGKNTMTGPK